MIRLYAVLCVVGAALPLFFVGSFLVDDGLDVGAFFDQMTGSDIALFAWGDVVVTAFAVVAFALHERGRGLVRWWVPVVATVAVGPSLGLPLLLFMRKRRAAAHV